MASSSPDNPTVLNYATQPARRSTLAAALANAGGQLAVLCAGVTVGEALLGLPSHEDGWAADLAIALTLGVPAAFYGLTVFAVVGKQMRARNVTMALTTGCLSGLVLTALLIGSNAVSERQGWIMAWVGLAILLVGPIIAVVLNGLCDRRGAGKSVAC